jgi:hypothetical protein
VKSGNPGKHTSAVEVSNVSKHGFWLLIGDIEHFLAFEHFPWFQDAPIGKLLNVELASSRHLYWPDLDIDLAVDSISRPDLFPLMSKRISEKKGPERTRGKTART